MKKPSIIFLLAIIFLALFFRFYALGQNDLLGDDGHYAFRALGWLDYLASNTQTAPIQWFGHIPWWANLSFHDHPPVMFLLQHVSFKFLGPTALAARLPVALFSLMAVIVFFYLMKKSKGEWPAIFAAGLLAISTHAVWVSRLSLNDGLVLSFEIVALFFLYQFIGQAQGRNLYGWAIFVGLALLSKYTAAFLLPAGLIYLIVWRREVFKKKEIWLVGIMLLIVLSPIIIYNFQIYITRGHFDACLSHMVGMRPNDFSLIKDRVVNFNLVNNFVAEIKSLYGACSFLFFLLKLTGLIYLLVKLGRKKADDFEKLVVITILSIMAMFLFMGPASRYFSIIDPWLIAAVVIFVFDFWSWIIHQKSFWLSGFSIVLFSLIVLSELLYSINTNLLVKPLGRPVRDYLADRSYNYGFNQLDLFIREKIYQPLPTLVRTTEFNRIPLSRLEVENHDFVVYDNTISWFGEIGYLSKYQIYYRLPVVSYSGFVQTFPNAKDALKFLEQVGAKRLWYIFAANPETQDVNLKQDHLRVGSMASLAENFEKAGIKPFIINDAAGQIAFKVYYLDVKNGQ
ncbi:MAG: glycosyltransferase family 39 protein [Candidatus Buchananbacteria bacterium]